MGYLKTPEARAERKRQETARQIRLQRRFEEGDTTLRKTLFGNIKPRRTGGMPVDSAEGVRFYHTGTTLPHEIGRVASQTEVDEKPGIISVEVIDERNMALLGIRQMNGEVLNFSVPTRPIIEPTSTPHHSE